MKTKTTLDAVIHFKSEWQFSCGNALYDGIKDHWYVTDANYIRSFHGNYSLICNKEQFDQCIEDCSNNFGVSTAYDEYKLAYKAIVTKIYKHVYTQEMLDKGLGLDIGMKFSTEAGEYHVHDINDKSICFVDEDGFFIGIPIGQAKPITPSVELFFGRAYQFTNEKSTIEHGIYYDGMLINQHGNHDLIVCNNIKPLKVS